VHFKLSGLTTDPMLRVITTIRVKSVTLCSFERHALAPTLV
jgi:hypothetical protein